MEVRGEALEQQSQACVAAVAAVFESGNRGRRDVGGLRFAG